MKRKPPSISPAVETLLGDLIDMSEEEIERIFAIAVNIGQNIESTTALIENPSKEVSESNLVYLGSEFTNPVILLRKDLEEEEISLEDYLIRLERISEGAKELVEANSSILGRKGVRERMRDMINQIILESEGISVINGLLQIGQSI